ncbi:PQQ-binding-like beta-propeller repeat protein [Salarchaeum sp. JOR-1]|uniref:outer membrane protein assembly factor BamB family protein n=1 Tax=Salarchaeum sp. JOR-1 TaxID=2599399 RepID=UPI0011987F0F|nr:PQQ-binding-like beta-propeller repeat protein [Salarchaeum sp. JOR-1]QDX39463.1 PQQ-binding-like beta-propeller repeat protein [Salarchaeum sp. JOR-1]
MRRRTTAVAAVLVLALAGVGAYAVLNGGGPGTLDVAWVSDTDRPNQVNHHPVAVAGTGEDATVLAPVSAVSGSSGHCRLVALDANGTRRWSAGIADRACAIHGIGDPTVFDLTDDGDREVFVPTAENAVYGYDVSSGEREFAGAMTSFGYSKSIALDDPRRVFAIDFGGRAYAWHPDGSVAWNVSVAPAIIADPIEMDDRIVVGMTDATIALHENGTRAWSVPVGAEWLVRVDETRIVASNGPRVSSIDTSTRTVEWTLDTAGRAVVHDATDGDGDGTRELYVGSRGGRVLAVDAATGTVEWQTRLSETTALTPAPITGNFTASPGPEVAAVTHSGQVAVLDADAGDVVASYERDVVVWVHPTAADIDADPLDELLVMYGDGRVVALDA